MKVEKLFDQVCIAIKDIIDLGVEELNDPNVSEETKDEIRKLLRRLYITATKED